jgi:hypothetical protein
MNKKDKVFTDQECLDNIGEMIMQYIDTAFDLLKMALDMLEEQQELIAKANSPG